MTTQRRHALTLSLVDLVTGSCRLPAPSLGHGTGHSDRSHPAAGAVVGVPHRLGRHRAAGVQFVARLLSVLQTLRLRGGEGFDFLTEAPQG